MDLGPGLLLAARGAHVVINDIGTSRFGTGNDSSPASEQAARIRQAGGVAEADTSDISVPEGSRRTPTRGRHPTKSGSRLLRSSDRVSTPQEVRQ